MQLQSSFERTLIFIPVSVILGKKGLSSQANGGEQDPLSSPMENVKKVTPVTYNPTGRSPDVTLPPTAQSAFPVRGQVTDGKEGRVIGQELHSGREGRVIGWSITHRRLRSSNGGPQSDCAAPMGDCR
ncbi:hypothetical protein JZ751_012925, partial [Albula glossodonta]